MIWIIVVVALIILGIGIAAGFGHFGNMRLPEPKDVYEPDLPVGALSADDIRSVSFDVGIAGYNSAAVDELLARFAAELERRDAERAWLTAPVTNTYSDPPQQPESKSTYVQSDYELSSGLTPRRNIVENTE